MKNRYHNSKKDCFGCMMNRRQFLSGCAACTVGIGGLGAISSQYAAADTSTKPKVRLVFTHVPSNKPIWPNIGYDFDRRKKELTDKLASACPGVEFLPTTAQNNKEAKKIVEEDGNVDGYLVYMVGLWTGAPQAISAAGRPTIFVDDLYGGSGEFLIANAAARRAGLKVVGVSSSRFEDVAAAVRCFELLKKPGANIDNFIAAANAAWKKGIKPTGDMKCTPDMVEAIDPAECLKKLKDSTILVVGRNQEKISKAIRDVFGTKVLPIDFKEIHQAYLQADRDQAAQWADRWIKGAAKVVEPPRDEIIRSGAMYLAQRALMKKHNAQGISINCLGGFYGGHIKAYPCLGFSQLNNDGLVGGCEGDLVSAITMLTMTYLTGRPGYISDPVIDTSKNQIIYAHCVAPTKVFGPNGPNNPYHIRSHSEDRKGASFRSLMPLGYMTTTIEFHPLRKQVIMHQGKSVANIDEDKACRTKLAVEVKGDIDKLMNEWDQWSWHRVTCYGDLKKPVEQMAKALGMKVLIEA
ncbi:MAG: hypothetical protein JSV03_12925 [Planctomycetota bacterium]|nr:MAG: hypothetical protein JSV03_12925 [Planctomycetota bacterium]